MIGDYEVVKDYKIGRGSFGRIYPVTSPEHEDEIFALKKINLQGCNEKERQHCLDEVRQLQSCDHPNIVKYVDSFRNGIYLCIVMEYCHGGNLRQYIQKQKYIQEQEFLQLFTQICNGIKYLHDKKVVHRDVKTTNILLTEEHQIKIADLGLAKTVENVTDFTRSVGSPYFMSPEMINGQPYTLKTDIWSLGCCMYEMGTGNLLFKTDNTESLKTHINDTRKIEKLAIKVPYCDALKACLTNMLFEEPDCRPTIEKVLYSLKSSFHMHGTVRLSEGHRSGQDTAVRRKTFIYGIDVKVSKDSGYSDGTKTVDISQDETTVDESFNSSVAEDSMAFKEEKGTQTSGASAVKFDESFGFPDSATRGREDETSFNKDESIEEWNKAIREGSESNVTSLLDRGVLPPTSGIVNKVSWKWKRTSVIVRRMSHAICTWIKDRWSVDKTADQAIHVTAVYEASRDTQKRIFFLVTMNDPQIEHTIKAWNLDYNLIFHKQGEYNEEGAYVRRKEQNHRMRKEDANKLSCCLKKNNVNLMRSHSNLQIVSASHLKSRKYKTSNSSSTTSECPCIVFYVTKKGYIPLQEKLLPSRLDGILTDVREGGFEFCTGASEWHPKLKMGCQISGDRISQYGTLGAFLKNGGEIYCLTSAHVAFGDLPADQSYHRWNPEGTSMNMYQPRHDPSSFFLAQPFGEVCSMIFRPGDDVRSGMEIAVIRVTNRHPDSGTFPDGCTASDDPVYDTFREDEPILYQRQPRTRTLSGNIMEFRTGHICEKEFFEQNNGVEVIKFGCETGKTRGIFRLHGTAVRKQYLTQDNGSILLFNQIEISNSIDGVEFAKHGDSGALILVPYAGNRTDLRAVAILEGRSSDGTILATPICNILDELGVTDRKLMQFSIPHVLHSVSVDSGTHLSPDIPGASNPLGADRNFSVAQASGQQESEVDYKIRLLKDNYLYPSFQSVEQRFNKVDHSLNSLVGMMQDLVKNAKAEREQNARSDRHADNRGDRPH